MNCGIEVNLLNLQNEVDLYGRAKIQMFFVNL